MVLVAAPFHPLAKEPAPITEATLLRHRAVSVADSSRLLPPRTLGLLSGQDVLTVASLDAKVAAHVAGLGVGWLPRWIAEREALGRAALVILEAGGAAPGRRDGGRLAPVLGGQGARSGS